MYPLSYTNTKTQGHACQTQRPPLEGTHVITVARSDDKHPAPMVVVMRMGIPDPLLGIEIRGSRCHVPRNPTIHPGTSYRPCPIPDDTDTNHPDKDGGPHVGVQLGYPCIDYLMWALI